MTPKDWSHAITNVDEGNRLGTCAVHGPDTPLTSKGLCLPHKNERRKARPAKTYSGRGRVYKSLAGDVVVTKGQLEAWHKGNPNCAICGVDFSSLSPKERHLDHCHTTGKIRGVLCQRCNLMLGAAKDNVEVLRSAIGYLSQ